MKRTFVNAHDTQPLGRGHPQFYAVEFGHEPGDFWIHWHVRARSPLKARRKARRLQLKTNWPYMRCLGPMKTSKA